MKSEKIDIVAYDNRGFTFGFATGMGYRRTSSYIQNLTRNIPAAYELLPTTRSTAYVQVNGVDQTATNAWNILKN